MGTGLAFGEAGEMHIPIFFFHNFLLFNSNNNIMHIIFFFFHIIISLCNVLVSILSKVLTNRLKPCLHSIVADKQSAFIEGRLLTYNVMVAFEINNYTGRKTQGNKGVAGLEIDISKAYDRLKWDFKKNMMSSLGFMGNGLIKL